MHPRALHLVDGQRNLAVVQEQHVAGFDVLVQLVVGNADTLLVALHVTQRRIDKKAGAVDQLGAGRRKPLDANFRPLQITHDAHVFAALGRDLAQQFHPLALIVAVAV